MSNVEERDLRAILADLQAEIRRHRLALGEMGAISLPDPLAHVRERQAVNPHLPIGWPVMPRGLWARLVAYTQKVTRRLLRWYINPIVAQQNEFNAAATELLATLQARVEEHARRIQALDGGQERDIRQEIQAAFDARLAQFQRRAEAEQETIALRLQRLENWRKEPGFSTATPAGSSDPGAIDYFLLGALYRNRSQMSERLGEYDDLFRGLAGGAEQSSQASPLPVLDIGCGRGEWVAHLRSLGLPAYGIDIEVDALAIGQAQGLDLRHADAVAHLQGLPDNNLAAVTLIQVIEHFAPESLLRLLQLAARKLAPGGFVVAETINPACLHALANWYLMDPSHHMPVHHETTRFLMAQAGFHRIEIRFVHPVPEEEQLLRVSLGEGQRDAALAELAERLQRNTEQLNRFLYGPQDYAAIAFKPES